MIALLAIVAVSDAVLVSIIGSAATLLGIVITVAVPAALSHRSLKKNVLGKPNGLGNIVQMLEASMGKLDMLAKDVDEVKSEQRIQGVTIDTLIDQHQEFRQRLGM